MIGEKNSRNGDCDLTEEQSNDAKASIQAMTGTGWLTAAMKRRASLTRPNPSCLESLLAVLCCSVLWSSPPSCHPLVSLVMTGPQATQVARTRWLGQSFDQLRSDVQQGRESSLVGNR